MDVNGQVVSPTAYEEVNTVLLDLSTRIRKILGSQFVGLYLYGSLALGDFDPQTSDIDYLVVTQLELSPELIPALKAMHEEYDRSGSPWAGKVEAAYIPLAGLNMRLRRPRSIPRLKRARSFSWHPGKLAGHFSVLPCVSGGW